MLELENVTVSYGDMVAVNNLSMSVEPGSLTVLLGPNGAGKTTTLKAISRIVDPDSGSISFEGEDLLAHEAYEIPEFGVAHIPEESRVFPEMTVIDNLMIGGNLSGTDTDVSLEWVYDLFPVLEERKQREVHLGLPASLVIESCSIEPPE